MNLDRKALLLEEKEKRPLEKEKTDKTLTEGGALMSMLDTFGWKIVYEEFIEPNTNESRWLSASKEELVDIRAEIRILKALLSFINVRIKEAGKLSAKLKV